MHSPFIRKSGKAMIQVLYCMVCAYVREYNTQLYNNVLIALAYMCTLCIVRLLMSNIGL